MVQGFWDEFMGLRVRGGWGSWSMVCAGGFVWWDDLFDVSMWLLVLSFAVITSLYSELQDVCEPLKWHEDILILVNCLVEAVSLKGKERCIWMFLLIPGLPLEGQKEERERDWCLVQNVQSRISAC